MISAPTVMSPLTFNIIRQSTQLSAARRGTVAMNSVALANSSTASLAGQERVEASSKRVIETPGCFMYTVKGSVPHFTPDTMRLQDFGGVNVSIEHILQEHQPAGFEKWPSSLSLSKYLHLQDFILFCDIRDSSRHAKVPLSSNRHVSMMTHRGVRQLVLEEYLKIVRAYEPDIVAAFSDSILDLDQTEEDGRLQSPGPGQKRVRKSVERNLKWLDQILRDRQGFDAVVEERAFEKAKKNKKNNEQDSSNGLDGMERTLEDTERPNLVSISEAKQTKKPWAGVSVFAHVVGSHIEQERIQSAQETAKRQEVDGFVIDTLSLPGTKDDILRLLKVSIDHLPTEKPRVVYGIQTPEDVLRSISLGADLFDTSYPSQLTENGKASLYSFGTSPTSLPPSSSDRGTNKRWINLWDDEHSDKFVPLLEGCECYACKDGRHTRAYINHLLKAHEMLASVLLMSHNMHQYSKFFASIRQSIEVGTFEEQSASFIETFGKEPEQTGVVHAAQAAVEVALSKRNRLNFNTAALAAEEREGQKNKTKEARRTKKEEGIRNLVNTEEKRVEKLQQEPQLPQQKEQEP